MVPGELRDASATAMSPSAEPDRQLLDAARDGNVAGVAEAIAAGADVNARDAQGLTPLMHAARRGDDLELVKTLVISGADVRARDGEGKTAVEQIAFPPEPPEQWENSYESWRHATEFYIACYLYDLEGQGSQHD